MPAPTTHQPPRSILEIPDTVQARVRTAARLQSTRQRIARLGAFYVRQERADNFNGSRYARENAARNTREWRAVALANGWTPAAIRRLVLDDDAQ